MSTPVSARYGGGAAAWDRALAAQGTRGVDSKGSGKYGALEGYGNQLQYSCLENPPEREAWQATVHRVSKSWIHLK